jgi:pimeloyl-ACP methyl ester carboxylesterase
MSSLYSNILGSGRPLLILHGFLGMSDNWKTLGSRYAEEGFEVHLIDQRNHGRSFWSEEFNYTVLAEDINGYLKEHRIPSAHILGHSMGGKTAMQFACSYQEKVISLMVADIAPRYYPPHHDYILNGLLTLSPADLTSRTAADEALSANIKDWGIRQFLLKNLYWKEKERLAFRFNLEVLSERMNEIGEAISGSERYNGPALFLRGSKSEYVQDQDLPEIRNHFPKAELRTIEKAGHWLHAENPEQFFSVSLAFLNS